MKLCVTAARAGKKSGVALVITLLLLSVITFMAIAFLVLSRGQKSSVTTTTDEAIARGMAEGAFARAEAEMLAPVVVFTNPFNYGMLVSTNYISPLGFVPGNISPTNVNYVGRNGAFLTGKDLVQNIANLEFNPRAPVFYTNRVSGGYDFRYYLDLNRNGAFEPSGWIGVTNNLGSGVFTGPNQTLAQIYQQGDPQWIGALEFPDRPHAADNRFMGRYAYLVVPISQTLDINYIHNQAKNPNKATFDSGGRDFLRNQGVAPWEINLASFLYDLNTNLYAWGGVYNYDPIGGFITGNAFVDAFAILNYRYGGSPLTQPNVANSFFNGRSAFDSDGIDGYTGGPLMTGVRLPPGIDPDAIGNRTIRPWPGSDNTNHFFSTQDLFDRTKTSTHFTNALLTAGSKTNTYDRYTFYRLLSELGTDSAPAPARINLNYDNVFQTNALGVRNATNFIPWQPLSFFTNVANALLADAGYNFTITNIPIYPTNYYTAGVHRLLQLAVNIYDATTNRPFGNGQYPYCPTVLRPLFRRVTYGTTNVILIAGYREVLGTSMANSVTGPPMVELDSGIPGVNAQTIRAYGYPPQTLERLEPMISGMPLIVGAKKGFPNFNEFSMQTYMFITRLLQFKRDVPNGPVNHTNQMYVVALTNTFGLEAWNSYITNYPANRPLQLIAAADMTTIITNELGHVLSSNRVSRAANLPSITTWPGWPDIYHTAQSFILPWGLSNYCTFITNSTVLNQPSSFANTNSVVRQTPIFDSALQNPGFFYTPIWYLNVNTRIRFILVDTVANRIVDYVNLNHWEPTVDLTALLTQGATCELGDLQNAAEQWCTNRLHGSTDPRVPTIGVLNQIAVGVTGTTDWNNFSLDPYAGQDVQKAIQSFRYNLMNLPTPGETFAKSNLFYAPFDPYKPIFVQTSFEANDPLVHYTIGDLIDLSVTNQIFTTQPSRPWSDLGQVNQRYEPWGGPPFRQNPTIPAYQIAAKDPMVQRPDNWDFPTNKFPNVGWLGRVHRGTPWQTVYLKSPNILLQPGGTLAQNAHLWSQWTGNPQIWGQVTNLYQGRMVTNWVPIPSSLVYFGPTNFPDSLYSVPTNDWRILDLFTTAFNDNATRGQLSVNQTGLAAWSAVLAGVNVLPDLLQTSTFIQPARVFDTNAPIATWPPLVRIWQGIINNRTNFPNNTYPRMGDILATPELTVASPYLSTNVNFINDEVVERIPQQIMGLLRTGDQPRFVIYSYGQALKPAAHSVIPNAAFGNQFIGLCTNYQVTAEVATRAVVRIDGAPQNPHAVVESFNMLPPD